MHFFWSFVHNLYTSKWLFEAENKIPCFKNNKKHTEKSYLLASDTKIG